MKIWIIRISFTLIFLALIANIYSIQINKGQYYTQKAQAQEEAMGTLNPSRGIIYFTDKQNNEIPAVLNKNYPIIYSVPKEIKTPASTAKALAPIVGKDESWLVKIFSKPNDLYELILDKGTDDQVAQIKALNLPGIYIKDQVFRFYPFGTMASQLLGFISPSQNSDELVGRYGLELQFEKKLRGESGQAIGGQIEDPIDGENVYTTIDRNIQSEVEKEIAELVKEWSADGASALVQDPQTGKILAMASYPNFDPNNYSQFDVKDFINPTVQLLYEPGSVFKPLTMSAGIDSGKITPQTTYNDVGYLKLDGFTIRNWDLKAYGITTMTNVIEHSLNLGAAFAEKTMGNSIFSSYIKNFGFDSKTGIQLPGEVQANIRNFNSKYAIDWATMSYGQGISVTPLEMIDAFSTIANGGVLMKPLILKDEKPEVVRRVMSADTAKKVSDMMVSAVHVNVLADIPQYNIAGKTGTAFIPDLKKGGYSDNVINTYMGFAPASNARFTILIKLVNPKNAPLAGETVVPSFKRVAEYLLNYYEIPPDNPTAN